MKNAFASKISYFILTFVFLIIVASFLFSGFDRSSGTGGSKQVASVDGTPVTTREYQSMLQSQLDFFSQMMGGKGMSKEQQKEIGESVLNGLVQQKLILNTADAMGIVISQQEIKNDIKNVPQFKTNEQFNVSLYRNLLAANGFNPKQYEDHVASILKQKKVDSMFNSTVISENLAQDVISFKNNTMTAHAVKISRQALSPLVTVSEQEIKDYLAKPENKKNLETAYTENLSKYVRAEEVKARHILVQGEDAKALDKIKAIKARVTPKNFAAVATKESEDPTGKNNGGDLGWFSAGRMVPEFEEVAFKLPKGEISDPIKTQFGYHIIYVEDKKAEDKKSLESVQHELAQIALQKTKAQDLDKLLKAETERLSAALKSDNLGDVEAAAKKVDGDFFRSSTINQYDQKIGELKLGPQEADQLFKAAPGTVLNFGNPGTIYLVKVLTKSNASAPVSPDQIRSETAALNQAYSREVRTELMKSLNEKAKIVINPALL
jgi:peptidyl-prolyl cis-trans isomerase D